MELFDNTYETYMYKLENPCIQIETCEEYMCLKNCKSNLSIKDKKSLNYYNSYPFYIKLNLESKKEVKKVIRKFTV